MKNKLLGLYTQSRSLVTCYPRHFLVAVISSIVLGSTMLGLYFSANVVSFEHILATKSEHASADNTPQVHTNSSQLETILARMQDALDVSRSNYNTPGFVGQGDLSYRDIPVALAHGVGIIEDGHRYVDGSEYGSLVMTRAEAIKILVLLHTKKTGSSFSEVMFFDGPLPYSDLRRDAWYMPYVIYAHQSGLFSGFAEGGSDLRPLDVLTYKEMQSLLSAVGGTTVRVPGSARNGFITKRQFIESVVISFGDELFDKLRIIRGSNERFYTIILQELFGKSPQQQKEIIESTLATLLMVSHEALFDQYNYDLMGITLLFE